MAAFSQGSSLSFFSPFELAMGWVTNGRTRTEARSEAKALSSYREGKAPLRKSSGRATREDFLKFKDIHAKVEGRRVQDFIRSSSCCRARLIHPHLLEEGLLLHLLSDGLLLLIDRWECLVKMCPWDFPS